MSYDLTVFNPRTAPKSEKEFSEWLNAEWEEEKSCSDAIEPTKELRIWLLEMIIHFPAIEGPYAPDDMDSRDDENEFTFYHVGKNVISMSFRWSVAPRARFKLLELAQKHKVGFLDQTNGNIMFPNHDGVLESIN